MNMPTKRSKLSSDCASWGRQSASEDSLRELGVCRVCDRILDLRDLVNCSAANNIADTCHGDSDARSHIHLYTKANCPKGMWFSAYLPLS